MSQIELIQKKIRELDAGSLNEVGQFIDDLLEKKKPQKETYLKCTWAGTLKDLRDQYTSVELQKKALEWWIEEDVSGGH